MKKRLILGLLALSTAMEVASSSLDYAQVEQVNAVQSDEGTWCFSTTVRHNDEGWEHYADGWQVADLKGNQLGLRDLAHPHDNEQPFTRRLCNVIIPKDLTKLVVSAKCNQHGYGHQSIEVDLTKTKGDGFTVKSSFLEAH
ncbi:hypothetical protein [Aliivibrio kagoshimensis]|uniref:hypothetical protein n=1 Tax=Aliivibrio kagoshimensis TaxID=2910230 RepID=UPI003D12DEB5